MPNSRQLLRSVSICCFEIGSAIGRLRSVVGTLWSGVATRALGPAHLAAGQAQPFERLRAGHFVHEVQVDVENRLPAGLGVDDVVVPDFLEHRAGCGHQLSRFTDFGSSNDLKKQSVDQWFGRSHVHASRNPNSSY